MFKMAMDRIRSLIYTVVLILVFSNIAFSAPDSGDVDDIRPLKAPVEIKESIIPFLFAILVLLLIGAGILGFIYFRKKSRAAAAPIDIYRTPEEIAMDELKSLAEMNLIEKGMIREYYIKLSDIIRCYIERKYGILAIDRTTYELYQEMRIKKIERLHIDTIRDFLEDCDLVKFAKYIPGQKEAQGAYQKVEYIIQTWES